MSNPNLHPKPNYDTSMDCKILSIYQDSERYKRMCGVVCWWRSTLAHNTKGFVFLGHATRKGKRQQSVSVVRRGKSPIPILCKNILIIFFSPPTIQATAEGLRRQTNIIAWMKVLKAHKLAENSMNLLLCIRYKSQLSQYNMSPVRISLIN